jgi:integrase
MTEGLGARNSEGARAWRIASVPAFWPQSRLARLATRTSRRGGHQLLDALVREVQQIGDIANAEPPLVAAAAEELNRLFGTSGGKARGALAHAVPYIPRSKTVNNVLCVLSVLLKKAVEWEVIERMPCTVKLLRVDKGNAAFHDVDEYERLVDVARTIDTRTLLIVLLGGDAGLRCGEMIALEWADIDLAKRQLCVRQSDWNGQVGTPKNGRLRYVPLTRRLAATLADHRHLRSKRVLCQDDGKPFTRQIVQNRMILAAKRANVRKGIHILRHTFCSILAMRGAPATAIQLLAGHADLTMTQRYMHLSPAALDAAIQLLDRPSGDQKRGDILAISKLD